MLLNRSQAAFAQTGRVVWRRRVAGGLAAAGIGAAAAAGVVLGGGPAGAATFEVTTLNSTGDGSLAAAIELANAAPGADTITFAPGLTGTIAMPEGVTITDSVLITGPGADVLSLSGGGTHRVLDISAIGSVTISGLTIADGFTDADFFPGTGAGIRANVGSLALVDDALTNNTVRSPVGGEGGGVYFLGGDLAIAGSTFSGNRAAVDGGAVHVGSNSTTASIAGSTFTGNASPAGRGGALYTVGTILTVDASTFAGNSAYSDGGAITVESSSLTLTRSDLHGNTATGGPNAAPDAGRGGAISLLAAPSAVISRTTITGNTGTTGAAAVAADALLLSRGGTLSIDNSTITDNSAPSSQSGFAGTISVRNGVVATQLDHVTMTGNTNPEGGSAVDASSPATVAITNSALYNPGSSSEVTAPNPSITYSTVGTDPQLGPLQDNGGPTRTRLPVAGSPLIDAGDPAFPTGGTDQRGLNRVVRTTDQGAVEDQTPLPPVITVDTQPASVSVTAGQPATFTAACTAPNGAAVSYQWQLSTDGGQTFSPIADATAASHTIAATTPAQNGNQYRVECSAPGATSATSTAATLTVTAAPTKPPTGTPSTSTPPAPTRAATPAAPARSLASTGAATTSYLPLGVGILALGAAMVAATTRRRPH